MATIPQSTQQTLPALSARASLYKYVRLMDGGWKYLRANYTEERIYPHEVFLPKQSKPHVVHSGCYYAFDAKRWHRLSEDPAEAYRIASPSIGNGQRSTARERGKIPTVGGRSQRSRHFHARPRWQSGELEQRCGGN